MSFVSDLLGGGSNSSSGGYQASGNTGSYIPLDLQGENQNWMNVLTQLQNNNVPAQLYSQYADLSQSAVNNPFATGAQTSAGNAGTASTNTGNMDAANAATLNAAGNSYLPYATQALNAAFDPQTASYNQNVSNITNQANAENAAAGIGTSPVGASITDNTLANFANAWNAQKLSNQNTGINTANTVNNAAGNDLTAANTLGTAGATAINNGGQYPYTQYNTNLSNALSALSGQANFGNSANTQYQQILSDLMSYMGLGNSSYANANNAANSSFQNTMSGANSIGEGLGSIADITDLADLFA